MSNFVKYLCPRCGSRLSFFVKMMPEIFVINSYELECCNCGLKISESNKEDFLKRLEEMYGIEKYEFTGDGYIQPKDGGK